MSLPQWLKGINHKWHTARYLGVSNYWLQITTTMLAVGEFKHYECQNPALSIILSCSIYLLLYIILLYDCIKLILLPLLWYLKYTFPYWIFVHVSCFRILHICQYNEMSLFLFLSLHRAFWRFTYHIPTNALIISFII
jgi:hypothetical protein